MSSSTNNNTNRNVRAPVFESDLSIHEYDPSQRRPRGFVAGRGCLARENPFAPRRRSDTNVLAPMRAGVDRPGRSRESPFAPREPVRYKISHTVFTAWRREQNAQRMKKAVVARVAEQLTSRVDCPICMESVANPLILECGHMICRSDLGELQARRELKCPHCRGNLDFRNVTDKESFLKVHPSSSGTEEAK